MTALLTIARNTLLESLRQPIVLVIVLLSGFLQYLNTAISAYSMSYRNVAGEVTSDDKLLFDIGLGTVFLAGILLASFTATATMSREIENKTVLTVVSKPVGRPTVVVGKFLGVSAAMLLAVLTMVAYLLLALRHGVLTTVADDIDQPVVFLGVGLSVLGLLFSAFGNYAYGWSFAQTAVITLFLAAWGSLPVILFFDETWTLQTPLTDFKPQVLITCAAAACGLMVITAVAVAASTRLGQVMTVVVCLGVFLLGLLSNHLLGRYAFENRPVGRIAEAVPADRPFEGLDEPGDVYVLTLEEASLSPPERGDPIWYGPAPNGVGLVPPRFERPSPEVDLERTLFEPAVPPALVALSYEGETLTIKHIGGRPLSVPRPPEAGDFVFDRPTDINPVARVAWGIVPNLHFFWLVDAVTAAQLIPLSHLGLVAVYCFLQIAACLAFAVALFQTRDVG